MIIRFADIKNGSQKEFPITDIAPVGQKATCMEGCVLTMTGDLFDKYYLAIEIVVEREEGGRVIDRHNMFCGTYEECYSRYDEIRRALENGDQSFNMTFDDYYISRAEM